MRSKCCFFTAGSKRSSFKATPSKFQKAAATARISLGLMIRLWLHTEHLASESKCVRKDSCTPNQHRLIVFISLPTFSIQLIYREVQKGCNRLMHAFLSLLVRLEGKVAHEAAGSPTQTVIKRAPRYEAESAPFDHCSYAIETCTTIGWSTLQIFKQRVDPIEEEFFLAFAQACSRKDGSQFFLLELG